MTKPTNHTARPATTTDAGVPVASQEHSLTVGPDGPIVLHDHYLLEQRGDGRRRPRPLGRQRRRPRGQVQTPGGDRPAFAYWRNIDLSIGDRIEAAVKARLAYARRLGATPTDQPAPIDAPNGGDPWTKTSPAV